MYKVQVTNLRTGESEIVLLESPNQRDAIKCGIRCSVMVMSSSVKEDDCEAEIVSHRPGDEIPA